MDYAELVKANPALKDDVCPDGGKFTIQGDLANDGSITCSIHGPL